LSGHMRLAPHLSSQGAESRSALRFSRAGRTGCSALSLLAVQPKKAAAMPFRKKGATGLTERLDVRVSPEEKQQLRSLAARAGMPVAELVRLRALNNPVVPRTDETTIRDLRRLGGLLKKVHVDSRGAYSTATAAALADLHAAVRVLARGQ
jgi:hypothetical protein